MKTFSLDTGLSEERMVSTQFSPVPITNPSPGGDVGRCYMAEYNQVITGQEVAYFTPGVIIGIL